MKMNLYGGYEKASELRGLSFEITFKPYVDLSALNEIISSFFQEAEMDLFFLRIQTSFYQTSHLENSGSTKFRRRYENSNKYQRKISRAVHQRFIQVT